MNVEDYYYPSSLTSSSSNDSLPDLTLEEQIEIHIKKKRKCRNCCGVLDNIWYF